MAKRYFLYLSRSDTASVSYFLAEELSATPAADWIEDIFIHAVSALAKRRGQKIRNTPLTFWVSVRETARLAQGEVFVFSTPWRPGKAIDEELRSALATIPNGNILQGTEPIPDEAIPCCQIFRGKTIRFFGDFETHSGFQVPTVRRENNAPAISFRSFDSSEAIVHDETDMAQIYVRAEISSVADGDYYRLWQGALKSFAMLDD